MDKSEYIDHNGHAFLADSLLPCPFCGEKGEMHFVGNLASKTRKAIAKCTNKECRAEIINATLRNTTEWIAKITIECWNKRINK